MIRFTFAFITLYISFLVAGVLPETAPEWIASVVLVAAFTSCLLSVLVDAKKVS